MAEPRDIKLAKFLARLIVEAGEAGLHEIKPALEKIVAGRSAADRKSFLKYFHKAVTREFHRDTLTIESAEGLPDAVTDQIVHSFNEKHDRPIYVIQKQNPELIAGLRVRLGDSVYDASLAHNLQTLAARIR